MASKSECVSDVKAAACCPADGDSVAVVGVNRKLVIFDIDEVPVLGRNGRDFATI